MNVEFRLLERPGRDRSRWVLASVIVHLVVLVGAVSLGRGYVAPAAEERRVPLVFFDRPEPPRVAASIDPPTTRLPHRARALQRPVAPAPAPQTPVAPAAQPTEPQPLVTGLALSSTTTGSVALAAGNTLAPVASGGAREVSGSRGHPSGGGTSARPRFLDNVSAEQVRRFYPAEARRAGVQAAVRVKLLVDEQGRVARATLLVDPGHDFGAAALNLARLYRFTPALIDGRAVPTEIEFTIRFELE